ncbi:MAG: 4a-hydroxytetrahydrobiopterin dehydratase [Rhizobium sp.]|nr:4a-hydroxytetrahydrobiopterin dehydratase [Rhizobium sp.]
MASEKLSPTEIAERLQEVDGWVLSDDDVAIRKTFKFGNFAEAFAFMTECAIHAEKLDHHPEWSNVYRTVEVTLTTHSAKGVTELDFALATRMDKAARH